MKRLRTTILVGSCAVVVAYASGASGPLMVTVGVCTAALTYALASH